MATPKKLTDYLKLPAYDPNLFGPTFSKAVSATRTLPNGGGTYQAPVGGFQTPVSTGQSMNPVNSGNLFTSKITPPPAVIPPPTQNLPRPQVGSFGGTEALPQKYDYNAGVVTKSPTGSYQALTGLPAKFINPKTGAPYSVQEFVDNVANTLPQAPGDIPTYAGDILTQGAQTKEQLQARAGDLSASRGDIATGTTDPYKVASQSGINYTPTELAAIEKAYAGIYDPAINTALSKLDTKNKEEAAALAQRNKLAEMAQQHKYDMELKGLTAGGTGTGVYTPGANPTVDSWAQGLLDGSRKMTDVPANLKSAVQLAVTSGGNQANGKPTTTELGKSALATAKELMKKFETGTGISAVGKSRFLGYGAFPPPGTDAANFTNDFNAVKSQLSLEAVKYLKGQGSVSDAERALLAQAATKLNLSQSEGEFKKTLQGIIDKLEGNSVNTPVTTAAPDGSGDTIVLTD